MAKLRLEISSYWQVGSGVGSGSVADAVVQRDSDGLPFLPGRSLKGLVRQAMETAVLAGHVAAGNVEHWFGSALPGFVSNAEDQEEKLERGRFATVEARLWFGSARLPKEWGAWLRQGAEDEATRQSVRDALFHLVSSTSIDDRGIARQGSLRVVEVAVPMTLEAEVNGPADEPTWKKDLQACLPLLRSLGVRRNRGYGRVSAQLEGV